MLLDVDEMVVFKILSENFNLFFEIVYFLLNLFIVCVFKNKKIKNLSKIFIYLFIEIKFCIEYNFWNVYK